MNEREGRESERRKNFREGDNEMVREGNGKDILEP